MREDRDSLDDCAIAACRSITVCLLEVCIIPSPGLRVLVRKGEGGAEWRVLLDVILPAPVSIRVCRGWGRIHRLADAVEKNTVSAPRYSDEG